MTHPLHAGFIPLVDAAPLIVAREKGFAEAQGIELHLKRSSSWAGLRDRLSVGDVQCAHMLPPIAIASQLGLGNPKAPMVVPCGMSMNGNAVSVSYALHQKMVAHGWSNADLRDPLASARAVAAVAKERKSAGAPPLTFASVYPFSPHTYELRYWLAAGGLNPDQDVHLTIVPPPMMENAVEEGHVDGFCVGAPWSARSAAGKHSHIVCLKVDMWAQGPEKVLAMQENWSADHPELTFSAVRMLFDAAKWCSQEGNLNELAQILCGANYLDMSVDPILDALNGTMRGTHHVGVQNHLLFDPLQASYPRREHAAWFYAQMVRWQQTAFSHDALEAAKNTYKTDAYLQALEGRNEAAGGEVGVGKPVLKGPDDALAGDALALFDGRPFNPDDIPTYLSSF